jgi:phospholipid-binding lipoprotein MlaA
VRDSVGLAGDRFINPITYVPPCWLSASISGFKATNQGTFRKESYELMMSEALDPYVAMRQAYVQLRAAQILDESEAEPTASEDETMHEDSEDENSMP